MEICFQFNRPEAKGVGSITVSAPNVTGAEQDIVILDSDGKAIAVIQMQPGYDREEIERSE